MQSGDILIIDMFVQYDKDMNMSYQEWQKNSVSIYTQRHSYSKKILHEKFGISTENIHIHTVFDETLSDIIESISF